MHICISISCLFVLMSLTSKAKDYSALEFMYKAEITACYPNNCVIRTCAISHGFLMEDGILIFPLSGFLNVENRNTEYTIRILSVATNVIAYDSKENDPSKKFEIVDVNFAQGLIYISCSSLSAGYGFKYIDNNVTNDPHTSFKVKSQFPYEKEKITFMEKYDPDKLKLLKFDELYDPNQPNAANGLISKMYGSVFYSIQKQFANAKFFRCNKTLSIQNLDEENCGSPLYLEDSKTKNKYILGALIFRHINGPEDLLNSVHKPTYPIYSQVQQHGNGRCLDILRNCNLTENELAFLANLREMSWGNIHVDVEIKTELNTLSDSYGYGDNWTDLFLQNPFLSYSYIFMWPRVKSGAPKSDPANKSESTFSVCNNFSMYFQKNFFGQNIKDAINKHDNEKLPWCPGLSYACCYYYLYASQQTQTQYREVAIKHADKLDSIYIHYTKSRSGEEAAWFDELEKLSSVEGGKKILSVSAVISGVRADTDIDKIYTQFSESNKFCEKFYLAEQMNQYIESAALESPKTTAANTLDKANNMKRAVDLERTDIKKNLARNIAVLCSIDCCLEREQYINSAKKDYYCDSDLIKFLDGLCTISCTETQELKKIDFYDVASDAARACNFTSTDDVRIYVNEIEYMTDTSLHAKGTIRVSYGSPDYESVSYLKNCFPYGKWDIPTNVKAAIFIENVMNRIKYKDPGSIATTKLYIRGCTDGVSFHKPIVFNSDFDNYEWYASPYPKKDSLTIIGPADLEKIGEKKPYTVTTLNNRLKNNPHPDKKQYKLNSYSNGILGAYRALALRKRINFNSIPEHQVYIISCYSTRIGYSDETLRRVEFLIIMQ